ncbi:IMP dehydrogenase, partial [Bacillus cereus ATCC 10876]|nr:IMP dehydrogenase [Bacillus cereus ATCC 10876]
MAGAITVANNKTSVKDVVTVKEVKTGDGIKGYDAATKGTELGTATVGENAVEAKIE